MGAVGTASLRAPILFPRGKACLAGTLSTPVLSITKDGVGLRAAERAPSDFAGVARDRASDRRPVDVLHGVKGGTHEVGPKADERGPRL